MMQIKKRRVRRPHGSEVTMQAFQLKQYGLGGARAASKVVQRSTQMCSRSRTFGAAAMLSVAAGLDTRADAAQSTSMIAEPTPMLSTTARSLNPRRVFVLGATGTIGGAAVHALMRRGHEVVCMVRARPGCVGHGRGTTASGFSPVPLFGSGTLRIRYPSCATDSAANTSMCWCLVSLRAPVCPAMRGPSAIVPM